MPYTGCVKSEITQRELRRASGAIMRALDRGESFVVTRNGVAVGELRPVRRRRFVSASRVLEAFTGPRRSTPGASGVRSTPSLTWIRRLVPEHRRRGLLDTSVVIDLEGTSDIVPLVPSPSPLLLLSLVAATSRVSLSLAQRRVGH